MDPSSYKYWTLPEAIERLGVARSTLWRWVKSGRLRISHFGKRKMIPVEDLVTLYLVQPEAAPMFGAGIDPSNFPVAFNAHEPFSDEEEKQVAEALAKMLSQGGAAVNPGGLLPVIRLEIPPTVALWRYLAKGILRLTDRPRWMPSDEEMRQIRRTAEGEGIPFSEVAQRFERDQERRRYGPVTIG